jgi:hypothetical protein
MQGAGGGDAGKVDIQLLQSEEYLVQTLSHMPSLSRYGNKCTVAHTSCPAGEVQVLFVA